MTSIEAWILEYNILNIHCSDNLLAYSLAKLLLTVPEYEFVLRVICALAGGFL